MLIVKDIDKITKGMCMSSYECEKLEKAFIDEKFEDIEKWLLKKRKEMLED
jgi:hypothetical protein